MQKDLGLQAPGAETRFRPRFRRRLKARIERVWLRSGERRQESHATSSSIANRRECCDNNFHGLARTSNLSRQSHVTLWAWRSQPHSSDALLMLIVKLRTFSRRTTRKWVSGSLERQVPRLDLTTEQRGSALLDIAWPEAVWMLAEIHGRCSHSVNQAAIHSTSLASRSHMEQSPHSCRLAVREIVQKKHFSHICYLTLTAACSSNLGSVPSDKEGALR